MASTSLQPLLIFDLFLLNSTTFVVRTRGFVCVVYLLSCLASHKDPCKFCMLAVFIPQYIRTCLTKQNLFMVLICELWDIFIKLITSFSYLHSWWMKVVHRTLPWCLWHESFYGTHTKCSWSCGALMWIKEPSTAPITQGIPAVL